MSRLVGPHPFLSPKSLKTSLTLFLGLALSACSTAECPHGLDTIIVSPRVHTYLEWKPTKRSSEDLKRLTSPDK